ncbi:hypothetical protein DFQ27_009849, partial [Actinomortierella ambigua]
MVKLGPFVLATSVAILLISSKSVEAAMARRAYTLEDVVTSPEEYDQASGRIVVTPPAVMMAMAHNSLNQNFAKRDLYDDFYLSEIGEQEGPQEAEDDGEQQDSSNDATNVYVDNSNNYDLYAEDDVDDGDSSQPVNPSGGGFPWESLSTDDGEGNGDGNGESGFVNDGTNLPDGTPTQTGTPADSSYGGDDIAVPPTGEAGTEQSGEYVGDEGQADEEDQDDEEHDDDDDDDDEEGLPANENTESEQPGEDVDKVNLNGMPINGGAESPEGEHREEQLEAEQPEGSE